MKDIEKQKNKCAECGKPSEKKYCSKLCATRYWRKTSTVYKKNKCKICGKSCVNIYCSYKCRDIDRIVEHKTSCENCGIEFTYDRPAYIRRGQMKFCSKKCANEVYEINHNFFKGKDIEIIYEAMGFIFGNGYIYDIKKFELELRGTRKKLEEFKKLTKCGFPIKKARDKKTNKKTFKLLIRSEEWIHYLYNLGFSNTFEGHKFPTILDEYKIYFIKGYLNSNFCNTFTKVENNEKNKYFIIKTKSYDLLRGIAEVVNGVLYTQKLEFCLLVKNEEIFQK